MTLLDEPGVVTLAAGYPWSHAEVREALEHAEALGMSLSSAVVFLDWMAGRGVQRDPAVGMVALFELTRRRAMQ